MNFNVRTVRTERKRCVYSCPECEKHPGFPSGFENRRSPPVLTSQRRMMDSGMMHNCARNSNAENVRRCARSAPTLGIYPRDQDILDIPEHSQPRDDTSPRIKNPGENNTDCAQHAVLLRYIPRVTLSLSDRSLVLLVHPEGSAHRSPTNHHTFKNPKALRGYPPTGFSLLEPGDPAHHPAQHCTVDQHGEHREVGPPRAEGWELAG